MKRIQVRVGLALLLALLASAAVSQEREPAENGAAVYELRTYTTHRGRLDALHKRFREHTMKLFEKHGMENVIYWTPLEEDGTLSDDTLIYILKHENLNAAKRSWQAFRQDPQWQKVRRESEQDGPIVQKVTARFLKPTEFSPQP